ncbi:MAG: cupin domain-containing protein [Candidatus Thermoplasmatota archaeon]|nr:cupin domain-containing protein [Candidatus Thermoplasmatota archaeon]MBS3789777.1 cupin domain-containing protein [Candidatus Thermoplasmatota archaeon]
MEIFDLKSMEEKQEIYKEEEFKIRHIPLSEGEKIPPCEMPTYVIFYVLEGEAEVTVDDESVTLSKGKGLITEPATLSMETKEGVKILGIQISKGE